MSESLTPNLLLRFWHFPTLTLGPGRRLGIWLQGCSIHCPGCIAPENQPFDPTRAVSLDALFAGFAPLWAETGLNGVTLSGGEPTDQPEALRELLLRLNQCGPRDILLYSGYTKAQVLARSPWLADQIAALVDGPFLATAPATESWRGSTNQSLTLFREEFRDRYESWTRLQSRQLQLVRKDSGRYLIGIPRPQDRAVWQGLAQEEGQRD